MNQEEVSEVVSPIKNGESVKEESIVIEELVVETKSLDSSDAPDLISHNKIVANLAKDKKANATLISMSKYLTIESKDNELWLINSNAQLQNLVTQEMVEYLNSKFDAIIGGEHHIQFKFSPKAKTNSTQKPQGGESQQSEHFYKVFGQRPENVPESVELVESVPDPIKKGSNTGIEDDGQIEDLFDI
jgi:hypothetical protein